MKVLISSVFALLALILINTVVVSADSSVAVVAKKPSCHNATGSCTETHFVCANEEMIPHSRRCDGVEDCADGTDEYMCDSEHFHADKPITDMTVAERTALTEVSCIKCTCLKGTITITTSSTAAWRAIAFNSPRDKTLLTRAPSVQNKPCNSVWTDTLTLNVYKKQNKGCRGWVCCFRQEYCNVCNSGKLHTTNCWT
jgi:hypothetical protein